MTAELTIQVLHSVFTEPISRGFFGYCFCGADYIYGAEGARRYFESTGRVVQPGEDGCYITVNQTAAGAEFGTDAAGMAKLYYYDSRGIWAVSSSLTVLVDHLRANGVRLTPNFPQLQAMSWGVTFTKQMSSFSTIFNEIRLLPSARKLVLDERGLREVPISSGVSGLSYREALDEFIETWTSRLGSLLLDERVRLSIDLTGGVDSRAIFAMAQAALLRTGESASRIVFKSGTGPKWRRDLKIAQQIAESYQVPLNPPDAHGRARLSGEQSFQRWREVCLGVYLPIYMHDFVMDPFEIHINGGGGENHRHFYPAVAVEDFLREHEARAPSHLFTEWRRDTEQALEQLRNDTPSVEPLILHYREFRNRFHTGRPPLYRTGFAPLTTTLFHRVGRVGGMAHAGQLNFDIMANLAPELMDFPYDEPSKRPTEENRRNLTMLDAPKRGTPGETYVGSATPDTLRAAGGERGRRPLQLLAEGAARALESAPVVSLAEPALLESARATVDSALVAGRFEHATRAKGISFLLASDFVLSE